MRFKRSSLRYSETPAPATPYQAAQQLWDERIGSARVQGLSLAARRVRASPITAMVAGGLIWQIGRSTVTPYVVEITSKAMCARWDPRKRISIDGCADRNLLARFIREVRSLPLDRSFFARTGLRRMTPSPRVVGHAQRICARE